MDGELVYGCMGLGGAWSDDPLTAEDVDQAERAVLAALETGISWFDQADIYRRGKSETVLGRVLARHPSLRERMRVQTKCGIRLGEDGLEAAYDLSRASIVERVHGSLDRLGTEFVDVLLLHRPDPLMEPEEVAAACTELRSAGKVGAFGVSNMSAAQLGFLQAHLDEPLVVNQLEMSLRKRDWLEAGVLVNHPDGAAVSFPEGTIEYCRAHDVRLQAWGALAKGVYTGARDPERSAADERTAALIADLAADKGSTPEAILLGWLMRHPAGIEPVIGTADPDRIRACGGAAEQAAKMSRAEWYALYTAARGGPVP
ncbi:aldo/keto reductase [Amycolatopsis nigrescens]|uniref:aldo/keto reductase n=1 Tax=Amycolatopsis nigrescens TaxID=381445 RepID=UPI00039C2208|nr:aldo/keto reductase [Amycolatopsis nigrescens]